MISGDFIDETRAVLIETLWNVKKPASSVTNVIGMSINRNIVECKEAQEQ